MAAGTVSIKSVLLLATLGVVAAAAMMAMTTTTTMMTELLFLLPPVAAGTLLFAPSVWLWRREGGREVEGRTDMKTVVCSYAFSGTVGTVAVVALQALISYPTAFLLFGSEAERYLTEVGKTEGEIEGPEHRALRAAMARTWRYWVFILVFTFVAAGVVEETLKYLVVVGARRWGRVSSRPRDHVVTAIAAGLGFATVESVAYAYDAWKADEPTWLWGLTVVERVLFGLPGHPMMAALSAVSMVRRDREGRSTAAAAAATATATSTATATVTAWRAIRLSVLFHCIFDTSLLGVSAYDGHVGWIHPREGFSLFLMLLLVVAQFVTLALTLRARLRREDIRL